MPVWRTVVQIASPVLGGLGTNTFHARTDGGAAIPLTETTLQQLSEDLAAFYVAIDSVFCGGCVISNQGEWVSVSEDPPEAVQTDPWTLAAPGAVDALPPANCLVVGWRTNLPTKRGRGRTFLGPINEAVREDNGTPEETSRAQVQAAADAFIATFTPPGDGAFVVWSVEDQLGRDIEAARTRNQFAMLTSRRD